jgi:hypothetical protein
MGDMVTRPIAVGLVIGATVACVGIAVTIVAVAHVLDFKQYIATYKKSKTTNNAL